MNTAERVSLDGFNLFSEEVQQCPHLYYHAMRETTPVFQVPGTDIYMVTRHDLINPIVRDPATFSNSFNTTGLRPSSEVLERLGEVMATGWPQVATMLTIDPPQHTRYRGTISSYFSPRQMKVLQPDIAAIVDRLIDDLPPDGEVVDMVPALAVPVPIEAIAVVLNVPASKMADFKRWSDDAIAPIGTDISDDRRIEALRGVVEFQHYFAAQLESRRIDPIDDLMSSLVQAEIDVDGPDGEIAGTRPLDMPEMLSIVQQLLVAGNETTTKAITEGLRLLGEHPAEWERLHADPTGYAPHLVEEVLRLSTPTQGMFRTVTRDTEIEGVAIPKGSRLVLVYAAANRDPALWGDEPDVFDPERENLKQHVAFGKGIHFCPGAPLSRLEMTTVFEKLGQRLERITLADTNDFRYHPSFMLRGLVQLHASIERAV
jgi:cytochrome P450